MPIPHRNKIRNDLIELLKAKKSLETHKAFKLLATQWKLTHAECAEERSGEELYKNEIRWARHELKIAGVIAPPSISGRGVWKLTDAKFRKPFERADEDIGTSYYEGSIETVKVNAYERNTAARKKCLDHNGYSCVACGMDMESTYGHAGKESIHVHHLVEISSIGKKYEIDPLKDLVPVCPNCHHIIHRKKPAYSISEIKVMLGKK